LKILVVAAHPDDEILGMGGTILKHSKQRDVIKVIFLATGITSRKHSSYRNVPVYDVKKEENKKMLLEIQKLRNDAKKACELLGVKNIAFYDLPDNEMDSIPLLKIVKIIEKEIFHFKPEIVYTHHHGDLNVDHRLAFEATLTACRPIGNQVKEIICFEVPSSTEWNFPSSFRPNYFVDITNQKDKKIQAMKMYKNEIKIFPHPRSAKNLKVIFERWGSVSGLKNAEAFEIIRKIVP